jgi:hypothetical protein
MSYRIYLETKDGNKFERTETASRWIAAAAFEAFLKRDELDRKPVSVHLIHLRTALAVHQFDAPEGAENNWLGRIDQIAWPAGNGQVGRPAEMKGGGRHNVYLDVASVTRAAKLGKGNVSEGIRIALSRV